MRVIRTVNDVRQFFWYLVHDLKIAFHPDNDFADYVDKYDNPAFLPSKARFLNLQMIRAFEVCENNSVDIYELALEQTMAVVRLFEGICLN